MKIFLSFVSILWKIYVGLVFVTTALLIYPFTKILLWKTRWHKKVHTVFVYWSWTVRLLCLYPVKKMKNSALPDGPYILISNHSSYLDIFLMPSIFPKNPLLFLGKSELLAYPILRIYFKNLHIPVFRKDKMKAAKSFVQAKNAVKKGWSLIIFPEGGIPDEDLPRMVPFKEGAFKLAKSLNVPIVPVTFTNNFKLFSDPEHMDRVARPGVSKVYIHPFLTKDFIANQTEEAIMNYCFDIINEPLLETYPKLRSRNIKS